MKRFIFILVTLLICLPAAGMEKTPKVQDLALADVKSLLEKYE